MYKTIIILASMLFMLAGFAHADELLVRPRNATTQLLTSDNTWSGTNTFSGPITAGAGSGLSQLTLENNLSDGSADEYALRYVNGSLISRSGMTSLPLTGSGMNYDMLGLLAVPCSQKARFTVSSIFGITPTYPIYITTPSLSPDPYQDELELCDSRYAMGVVFQHTGADVEWNATGVYTGDFFTAETTGTSAVLNASDYLSIPLSATGSNVTHQIHKTIGTGVTQIELISKIDCNGSDRTAGTIYGVVGVAVEEEGLLFYPFEGGFIEAATGGSDTYYSVRANGTTTASTAELSAGVATVHIIITRKGVDTIDFSMKINGTEVATGTDATWIGGDLAAANLVVYNRSLAASTPTATVVNKNYGWIVTYAK